MKRFTIVLLLVSMVLLAVPTTSPVMAQDNACSAEDLNPWQVRAFDIFSRYQQIVVQGPGLPTIAALQALRRDLEAIPVPDCDVTPTPREMSDLINLKADALVLQILGDANLQAIQTASDEAYTVADGVFAGLNIIEDGGGTDLVTAITAPANGAVVEQRENNIEGTVNPADIGDNILWLFVLASDGLYYPQVNYACTAPETISVREGHTTWRMKAYLGADNDHGYSFELYLGTLTPEMSDDLLTVRFPEWCANNWVGAGMTEGEVYDDYGFVELASATVKRQ